ncbi:16S rRNA (cytidine(1402)-2'-O)-methyltransferase [Paenibacillus cisolokensis]|uniref:16S rRNA (cytidine(1402)-2'-O)-methyltransferase n=1 Tax=Paenibacillus cisolokensis TaxID=1658519 RepID=UPI003D2A5465
MKIQKSFGEQAGKGTLYLVGTPIGNLEDMTFRAIRTLKEVDLIAAEDTRQTRKLLTHFDIGTRLVSYHEHNKTASGAELLRLLETGLHVALVSDAGLPAVSDPGADLVREAIDRDIPVVPVPGANAALSALIISGLPTDRFTFAGFPPRERKELKDWLEAWIGSACGTLLVYESPHRLKKTLQAMLDVWGDRPIAMVRELTKRYEEAVRGTVSDCLEWIELHPPMGEYCLVIDLAANGGIEGVAKEMWWDGLSLADHVARYEHETGDRKEAIKRTAADRGMSRRDVYNAVMKR